MIKELHKTVKFARTSCFDLMIKRVNFLFCLYSFDMTVWLILMIFVTQNVKFMAFNMSGIFNRFLGYDLNFGTLSHSGPSLYCIVYNYKAIYNKENQHLVRHNCCYFV